MSPDAVGAAQIEDIPGYRDLVRIGHGGFSVVYRGHQEAFDREVAIKVLMVGPEEALQRRFLREVKLTGKLSGHPHVVTALDAGATWSGRPYLATALHARGSLHDRLMAEGPFPAAEVAAIGAKIADALTAAHKVGIVHRDVKPSNILVSQYGEPALADFGVAYLFNDNGKATLYDVFSPHHVAPEVVNGVQSGPSADIYALGSTLFQLLHGRTPFQNGEGEPVAAVLWKVVNDPTPSLPTPDLPELSNVIAKAMAKEPADRYADAQALTEALRALLPDATGSPAATSPAASPAAGAESDAPEKPAFLVKALEKQTSRIVQAPGGTPPAEPELTIFRPERMIDAPPPAKKKRRWWIWALAGTVVIAAIAATTIVLLSDKGKPLTQAPPAASVAPEVVEKARPTGVTVQDGGLTATIRWTPGVSPTNLVFVQVIEAGKAHNLQQVPDKATEFKVGLKKDTPYCFVVTALVALGNPPVMAPSVPIGIRGAVCTSTSTSASPSAPSIGAGTASPSPKR